MTDKDAATRKIADGTQDLLAEVRRLEVQNDRLRQALVATQAKLDDAEAKACAGKLAP